MAAKKQPKPFFKERREFLKRILGGKIDTSYTAEMVFVTRIFELMENDLEFLSKIKPPSFLKGSLAWFLSPDGKKFLNFKRKEFHFKVEKSENEVEFGEKFGEDVYEEKPKTLRQFLQ